MTAWLSLLLAAASGALLADRWPPVQRFHPRWMWRLLVFALGCAAGLGLGSALFFLLLWAGLASGAGVLLADFGMLLAAALLWRTGGRPSREEPPASPSAGAPIWILRGAGAVVLVALLSGWWVTTAASPHGDWDAFSIWNLRARFLASGEAGWKHAVSRGLSEQHLGASHPDYPLLLSGLVAKGWMLAGKAEPAFPAAVGLSFALLSLALVAGSLARLRGEEAGWIGFLLLGGSELFASQIAAQYADIPLACYALAAVALLAVALERPAASTLGWGGLFAALAAWTKNEGLVFALLALAWCAWRGRRQFLLPFAAGAAPVLALVMSFKLFVAPLTVGLFPASAAEALEKLTDLRRAYAIVEAYAATLWELGPWWAHPLALALVWIWASGLAELRRRRPLAVLALPLAMLAADFLVYMLTVADLRWHLSTSVNRLWLQMWPSLLVGLLLAAGSGTLEEQAAAIPTRQQPERRRVRGKTPAGRRNRGPAS